MSCRKQMEELEEGKAVRVERVNSVGCELEESLVSGSYMDESNEAASNNQREEGGSDGVASINLNVGEGNKDKGNATCITPLPSATLPVASIEIEKTVAPPKVGMVFVSWQEVEDYYRSYAKQVGFGISRVKAAYKGGKSKEKRSTTWRCECSGKPDSRRMKNGKRIARGLEVGGAGLVPTMPGMSDWVGLRAPRKSKKCDCPATVYASINSEGEWILRKVVLEHKNHIPNPNQFNYKNQNRQSSVTSWGRMTLYDGLNTVKSALHVHQNLARDKDSEETPIMEKDMHNVGAKERRLKLRDGDLTAMMTYIERMQKDSQNFFHSHRFDEKGVLQDVLWVDARCKAAYEEFGDVVYFDTMCLINEYELPLVNFLGVNQHGQTILFGCAFLSHEDMETFEWVFHTWLLCMGGNAPLGMLTDQASAMRKALTTVMPNTRHCWSLWHIMQKFGKELGRCDRYAHLKEELKNVIYDSFTMEEFQTQWLRVIEEYDLQSIEWLSQMYEERNMWVPAYTKHLFWAGMRTTQRVESIHSFFDEYVTKNTRVCEFLEKYCVAMEQRTCMERDADVNTTRYVRGLATGFKVEKVFQKMYTDAKFVEVQRECARVLYCTGRGETWVSETEVEHLMEDRVWVVCKSSKIEIPSTIRRLYRVRFNTDTNEVSCDCRLFESCGILCRHSIKVYDMNLVEDVPKKYILKRWRKDVPRKHTRVKVAYHDPSKTVEVMRFDKMMSAFELVCGNAMQMEEAMEIVINMVQAMDISVNECLGKISTSSVGECETMDVSQTTQSARTLKFAGSAVNPPPETASATNIVEDPPFNNMPVQSIKTGKGVLKSEQLVNETSIFEHEDDEEEDRRRKFGVMKKMKLDDAKCSQVIQVPPSATVHGEFQGQQQDPTSLEGMQFVGKAGPTSYLTRNVDQRDIDKGDDDNEHYTEPSSTTVTHIGGEGGPYLIRTISTKDDLLHWNRVSWE